MRNKKKKNELFYLFIIKSYSLEISTCISYCHAFSYFVVEFSKMSIKLGMKINYPSIIIQTTFHVEKLSHFVDWKIFCIVSSCEYMLLYEYDLLTIPKHCHVELKKKQQKKNKKKKKNCHSEKPAIKRTEKRM